MAEAQRGAKTNGEVKRDHRDAHVLFGSVVPQEWDALRELRDAGRIIDAIKRLRSVVDVGLADAVNAIRAL